MRSSASLQNNKIISMGVVEDINPLKPRRAFCHRCYKAAILCICNRIEKRVETSIGVTILQHTEEKKHPFGSARVASLGLKNLQIISVPELEHDICYRIRPKVPGSKRSIVGRVGKKGRIPIINEENNTQNDDSIETLEGSVETLTAKEALENGFGIEKLYIGHPISDLEGASDIHVPSWFTLPSGSALLYPSENAVDLSPGFLGFEVKHLVVLDGTWAKAKRVYLENPWLRLLPHLRLPWKDPSIYSEVRRQPKPGCLSTIESIVYALKILEPGTEGLDSLLQVFDSMVRDQRRCKEERLGKLAEA